MPVNSRKELFRRQYGGGISDAVRLVRVKENALADTVSSFRLDLTVADVEAAAVSSS